MALREFFGTWIDKTDQLKQDFVSAKPFEHVVLEDFFTPAVAELILTEFIPPEEQIAGWFVYNNPLERKWARNDVDQFSPSIGKCFEHWQSEAFVECIRQVTGISELEPDPHLHGAGMHYSPSNGKLDMHLDYSIHPKSGKERRVNLIVYLNKSWEASWGGALELWSGDDHGRISTLGKVIEPKFNTAVLFRTADMSYHGFPEPIRCPLGTGRKSLAVYYVAEPRPAASHRYKAQYFARPQDPPHEGLVRARHWQERSHPPQQTLREIRVSRIITPEDIERLVPGWGDALPLPKEYSR